MRRVAQGAVSVARGQLVFAGGMSPRLVTNATRCFPGIRTMHRKSPAIVLGAAFAVLSVDEAPAQELNWPPTGPTWETEPARAAMS